MPEPRNILLALCGITPQIITETLYCLMIQQQIPIREIWLITTQKGREMACQTLLSSENNFLTRFCQDFQIPADQIKLTPDQIITTSEQPDIQNLAANETFANRILQLVQEKTADPETVVHASLAGGRKTMSVYLAWALQFFGRPADKLYHVLVSPPAFENNLHFFYPPPVPGMIPGSNGQLVSTAAVRLELAEVPYIRLRSKLAYFFENQSLSFEEMVKFTQAELEQLPDLPPLVLHLFQQQLQIGAHKIQFSPIETALYWYYLERSQQRPIGISVKAYQRYFEYAEGSLFPDRSLTHFLTLYQTITSPGTFARFQDSLLNGHLEFERIIQIISRIKRKIQSTLQDAALSEYYIISAVGRYGKCYGIKLDPARVVVRK